LVQVEKLYGSIGVQRRVRQALADLYQSHRPLTAHLNSLAACVKLPPRTNRPIVTA
jgi:hypothetical protein